MVFLGGYLRKNEKWKTGYSVDKEEAGVYGVSGKEGFFDNQSLFSLFLGQILKKVLKYIFRQIGPEIACYW